jgi:hypothetical protein
MNVYKVIPQVEPQAIVVYCCDPRFQTAFGPFVEKELGLAPGQCIPLVVAGGAGVLANPDRLPKEFEFLKDRLELFHAHFASIRRLILINHEDCAYYKALAGKTPDLWTYAADLCHWPREDLGRIAQTIDQRLSHLGWKAQFYYAAFVHGDRGKVAFDRIAP